MANDEAWAFNGIDLHQEGWSVASLTGRFGVPALRGDDAQAAYVPGDLWMPKIPAARTLTLPMWVTGADPATGAAVDDPRRRWNDNWAYLMQVFWNPDAEGVLTRRWLRTDPATQSPIIQVAEAMAQLAPGEEIRAKMTGRTRAEFEVPLRLAHPFFYGPATTTKIRPGNGATIINPGDWTAWSKYLFIDFVGPLNRPVVTNHTRNITCGMTGAVTAGETVTLDVREFLALSSRSGASGKTNRSGETYNSGTRPWMALLRGSNNLSFSAGGSGYCNIRFRPPYH